MLSSIPGAKQKEVSPIWSQDHACRKKCYAQQLISNKYSDS